MGGERGLNAAALHHRADHEAVVRELPQRGLKPRQHEGSRHPAARPIARIRWVTRRATTTPRCHQLTISALPAIARRAQPDHVAAPGGSPRNFGTWLRKIRTPTR